MKCPKCGFQSFNYLPNCKKCGRDLSEMRDKYRLGDPVLPQIQAAQTTLPAQPVVDDPFETTLPDEKEISNAANLTSLPDEEVDADLADYFDEMNAIDPELAATLDPDSDWTENALAMEAFGLDEDGTEGSVEVEQEAVSDVTPESDSCATELAPSAEAVSAFATAEPFEEVEDTSDTPESSHVPSDEDFLLEDEEDEGLDDWLLDGEEPSWRRTAQAVPAVEIDDVLPEDAQEPDFDADSALEFHDDQSDVQEPEQVELPFEEDLETPSRRAPLIGRLLAILLDTGVLAASLALFVLAGEYLRRGQGVFTWPQPQDLTAQAGPYFLVFFGLAFGYFTMFHYLGGQTPGKMASKLLVVDLHGEPLQLSQAFLRSVGGLICLLPAGLGFCSALFNRKGRGWNDRLAGSVVVCATDSDDCD